MGVLVGFMQLGMTVDGRVKLTINTTTGEQTLVSSTSYSVPAGPVEPSNVGAGTLSASRWHTVAASYHEGELSLSVDGVVDVTSASGNLVYAQPDDTSPPTVPDTSQIALLAPVSDIRYNSFKIYDWNTNPLLTLSDPLSGVDPSSAPQNDSLVVGLNDEGRATLDVLSLGNLNSQQSGSKLSFLRVALISGDARDTVSVVSTQYYQDVSGVILETLAEGQPPFQEDTDGFVPTDLIIGSLGSLVPAAHAGIGSFLWGAVNFLVPVESVGILVQQL